MYYKKKFLKNYNFILKKKKKKKKKKKRFNGMYFTNYNSNKWGILLIARLKNIYYDNEAMFYDETHYPLRLTYECIYCIYIYASLRVSYNIIYWSVCVSNNYKVLLLLPMLSHIF
jgi:hypothetical protein